MKPMKVSQRESTNACAVHSGDYYASANRTSANRSDNAHASSVSPVQSPRNKSPQSSLSDKDKLSEEKVNNKPFISPKQNSRIGTFNVQSNLSQERLALLTNGMNIHNISLLGLSETNKIGSGSMVSHPFGETAPSAKLYWSGHSEDKKKHTGVALLVSAKANSSLVDWSAISDRILSARFVTRHCKLTVFVVYAPHSGHSKTAQNAFWSQLSDELRKVPTHDMLMVIGDMNANTGTSREGNASVLGPWTNPAERNIPGNHMIDICQTHRLCITNTFFRHKDIHRDTFRAKVVQGELKPGKMLDYILVNQRFRSSILDTRVYRDLAEMVGSDHEAVFSKVRIKFRSHAHFERPPRLDSSALTENERIRIDYRDTLFAELKQLQEFPDDEDDEIAPELSVEEQWSELKKAIGKAAEATLPEVERLARIPWMNDQCADAIVEKAKAFRAYRDALTEIGITDEERTARVSEKYELYKEARNASKIACRTAREKFWSEEAKQSEEDMKKRHYAAIFRRFRMFMRNKKRAPTDRIRDADGRMLTTKKDKLRRWGNYYQTLLYLDDFD